MAKSKTWLRKLGHWFNNLDVPNGLKSLMNTIGKSIDNVIKDSTGLGMTDKEKELSQTSLQNAQTLAQEDYERKIDFYERYESPEAQVRQYKNAGLNPALLYENGASVSASGGVGTGSAPAQDSSGALGAVFGSVLGMISKMKQIETDRILGSTRLDIDRYEAQTRRYQAQNYSAYLAEATRGKQMENDTFYSMFGLRQQEIESNISMKNAQTEYFVQVASSEVTRRQLMASGIRLNDVNTAISSVQRAILLAQSKYSDRYFKAVAELQEAEARMGNVDAGVYERLNEKDLLYHGAAAELADMIFRAGMDKDIWGGDAFKKAISGKMTEKDWTQSVIGLLKTLIGAGAVVGAGALRSASRAIAPPMVMSPGMQYQYYQAVGSRYDTTL